MRTRHEIPANELRAALADAGWDVASVEEGTEWWCRECWRLKSTWSPLGRQAFLTFLIDPMDDSQHPKIWAVLASAARPIDRSAEGVYTLAFGRGWPQELPQLVRHLNALRDAPGNG